MDWDHEGYADDIAKGIDLARDHIVLNFASQPPVFECQHCGVKEVLGLPLPITKVVELSDAFTKKHQGCPSPRVYRCTICRWTNVNKPAVFVATGRDGLQWFECADHGPGDHTPGDYRVALAPLEAWLKTGQRSL